MPVCVSPANVIFLISSPVFTITEPSQLAIAERHKFRQFDRYSQQTLDKFINCPYRFLGIPYGIVKIHICPPSMLRGDIVRYYNTRL